MASDNLKIQSAQSSDENVDQMGREHSEKLHAIHGLVGACTIQTHKLLTELSEDKNQPSEVNQAARIGVYKTRKLLFGDKPEGHA